MPRRQPLTNPAARHISEAIAAGYDTEDLAVDYAAGCLIRRGITDAAAYRYARAAWRDTDVAGAV
jgi:hypothetical protein